MYEFGVEIYKDCRVYFILLGAQKATLRAKSKYVDIYARVE